MFIDAEVYSELYLKDKSEESIRSEIEKLRDEISKIKERAENPLVEPDPLEYPTAHDTVALYREYMNKASAALMALTGDDGLTEEEKSARYVDSFICEIRRISLTVGVELQEKYVLTVGDNFTSLSRCVGGECENTEPSREKAISVLEALHMGEWRDRYSVEDFGMLVGDTFSWELKVEYRGSSAPRIYTGKGMFPYNFRLLARLLSVN